MRIVGRLLAVLFLVTGFASANAQVKQELNYTLGAGDLIRVNVFQNPDLTLETRVSESGIVTYPLIGGVALGGKTLAAAELQIADELRRGGFVQRPQVSILLLQVRGNQVSVLGNVNRPGRFPLETFKTRLSDVLALAGGIAPNGSDVVSIDGTRDGKPFRKEIDIAELYSGKTTQQDIYVASGDVIYVSRAPTFYVYGQAQRPGAYRVERGMTVQQAVALAGGVTPRGTERGIELYRKQSSGKIEDIDPDRFDLIAPEDVIYIRESAF